MMQVLSRPDARDSMSLPWQDIAWASFDQGVDKLRGLRIGLLLDAGCGLPVEPEVLAAVQAAARRFEAAGAIVTPMLPFMTQAMLDGMDHFWRMRSHLDLAALEPPTRPTCCPTSAPGPTVPPAWTARPYSAPASQFHAVRVATVKACAVFDYVISPTAPMPAFAAELPSPTNDPLRPLEHIGFTVPFNMSEQPAASINCGYTAAGCPSACRSPASALTTWACCRCRAPSS
jgi:aspartyl-tRNA(Asn)/glutamyl-tRNA(Gln) amidotransferase subunit A